MRNRTVKVLIVDDSPVSREIIRKGIIRDSGLEVIGTAEDPFAAVDFIENQEVPDVITLDINMPKMNGIVFLKKLMAQHPIPVVVISSEVNSVLDALEAGAVDFVAKPSISTIEELESFLDEIRYKLKTAATVRKEKICADRSVSQENPVPGVRLQKSTSIKIIAIGASTGGTEATLEILKTMPENVPGIVVVQHMPPVFTKMYADRLDKICKIHVREARNGDKIEDGVALIAPGGNQHMTVYKDGPSYYVRLKNGEKISGHLPSVDVLFASVAETAGANSIGIILTGMGRDGASGLLAMKKKGAYTIGQNEESCVVYGMPMVAYNIGAVVKKLPLSGITPEVLRVLSVK